MQIFINGQSVVEEGFEMSNFSIYQNFFYYYYYYFRSETLAGFLKWVSLFYCEYLPFDLINFLNNGENTIESAY